MSRGITSSETTPEHEPEIGYLRELAAAITYKFHSLPEMTYRRDLTHPLLVEWSIIHRPNLSGCEGFRNGIPQFAPDPGSHRALHEQDLKQVDDLVARLQSALDAKQSINEVISQKDIDNLHRVYRDLEVCQRKLVWR